MNFTEALQPWNAVGSPITASDLPSLYTKALANYTSANNQASTQAAACLLMSLTRGRAGSNFNEESLGSNTVADTDGDGMKEILDAWGQPLGFYRWATSNTELNPSGAQNGRNDPEDPLGTLWNATWFSGVLSAGPPPVSNGAAFQQLLHALPAPGGTQTQSYKLQWIIVSAGPNGKLGIKTPASGTTPDPMADDGFGDSNDNLSSNRLRFGGKGD
jgi:hypothetical protein